MNKKAFEEEFPWLISAVICFIIAIAIWQIFPHQAAAALQQNGIHITTPTTTSVWIPEGGRYQIYYIDKGQDNKITPSFLFRDTVNSRNIYSGPPSMERSFTVNKSKGVLVAEVMFPAAGNYELDTLQTPKTNFILTNQFPTKAVLLQLVSVIGGVFFAAIGLLFAYWFYVKYCKKMEEYKEIEEKESKLKKVEIPK